MMLKRTSNRFLLSGLFHVLSGGTIFATVVFFVLDVLVVVTVEVLTVVVVGNGVVPVVEVPVEVILEGVVEEVVELFGIPLESVLTDDGFIDIAVVSVLCAFVN